MHDGLHYPDNLYADHEERKARRSQQPTGAYRSTPEMPESERKLRTALSYVAHARDLITEALKAAEEDRKEAYNAALNQCRAGDEPTGQRMSGAIIDRIPKWDPAWGRPPNCDGHHPMAAEEIRDHDERLKGGEDRL